MNKRNLIGQLAIVASFLCVAASNAATPWSAQDYDLYSGDFNGDSKTDVLYIAKSSSISSGIAVWDAQSGAPTAPWQSWASNYLGIQWSGGLFVAVVGDFNSDGKSDVLLQRTSSGDSYLLLADATNKFTVISQTIASAALGIGWTRDQHIIQAGDFNGDGRADLFFQATNSSGTHAILLAGSNGLFSTTATQTWTDSNWNIFKWSTQHSVINVGDFNGDGKADLLVRAKPRIVMIDFDIAIPIPFFASNSFGVVLSQGGATPLQAAGVQRWNRNAFGVDWSPNVSDAVIGDFSGDGKSDVLLQAKKSGKTSYLLTATPGSTLFSNGIAIAASIVSSADSARLIVGNFSGTSGVVVYNQALTSSGTNSIGVVYSVSTAPPNCD